MMISKYNYLILTQKRRTKWEDLYGVQVKMHVL